MEKICQQCNKNFNAIRTSNKYCSKSCFGLSNKGENNPNWTGGKKKSRCAYCEKKFEFYITNRIRGKFCSYNCYLKSVSKTIKEKKKLKKEYDKIYHKKNRKRIEKLAKERRDKVKYDVLCKYSGKPPKCECCGEKMIEFLTIDHINGGGNKHRRLFKNSIPKFYKWLFDNSKSEDYQILCFNCNIAKGFYKVCPHQKKK